MCVFNLYCEFFLECFQAIIGCSYSDIPVTAGGKRHGTDDTGLVGGSNRCFHGCPTIRWGECNDCPVLWQEVLTHQGELDGVFTTPVAGVIEVNSGAGRGEILNAVLGLTGPPFTVEILTLHVPCFVTGRFTLPIIVLLST